MPNDKTFTMLSFGIKILTTKYEIMLHAMLLRADQGCKRTAFAYPDILG